MTNKQNETHESPEMPEIPEVKTLKHSKKLTKKQKAIRITIIVLCSIAGLIILLTAAVLVMRQIGKNELFGKKTEVSVPSDIVDSAEDDGNTVLYNKQKYILNENIVSIVCMGVDKKDISENKVNGINGQADSILVACLDTKTGVVRVIPISRETMVDINSYSAGGKYLGVERSQICLSYAYGATGAESCENVKQSVSRLLYGMPISSYYAVDMRGFEKITDYVGGITLNSLETINESSYKFYEGQQVKLTGAKALAYVRARSDDINANNRRVARQKQFVSALATKLKETAVADFTKVPAIYNVMQPYCVTDLSLSGTTYLVTCVLTANLGNTLEYLSIEGTTQMGEKFVEFIPDRTSLYEAVLAAFYTKSE